MMNRSTRAIRKTFCLLVLLFSLFPGSVLSSNDVGFSLRHGGQQQQQNQRRLLSCSRDCPGFVEKIKSCGKWRDAISGITSACNWYNDEVNRLNNLISNLQRCNLDNPPNPLCATISTLQQTLQDVEDGISDTVNTLNNQINSLQGEIASLTGKAQSAVDDLASVPGEIDDVVTDIVDIETVAGRVADGAVEAIKKLKFLPDSALEFAGYLANAFLDTFGEVCVPYDCLAKMIGDVDISDVPLYTNDHLSFSTDISPTTCLRVKQVEFDTSKLQLFLDQFSDLEAFNDIYRAVRKYVGEEMAEALEVTEEAKPLLNSMKSTVNSAVSALKSIPNIVRRRKLVVAHTNETITMEEASLLAYEKGVAKFHELYDEMAQHVFQDRRLTENAAEYIGFTSFKLEIEQGFKQDFILMASSRTGFSDSVFDKSLHETKNIPVPGTFGLLNIVGSATMQAAMPYTMALEGEATAIFGYDTGSVIMSVDLVKGSVTASSPKFSTDLDVDAKSWLSGFMSLSFQVAGSLGICVGPTQNACLTIQIDASQESAAGFDALAQVNIGDDLGGPVPLTTMFTDVLEYGSQPECVNQQVSISAGYWQYIMSPAVKVTLTGPDVCVDAMPTPLTLYDLEPKILQHTMNNYCLSSDILPRPEEFPTHSPVPTETPSFSPAPSQSPAPSSVPTIAPTSAPSPPPTNPPDLSLLRVDLNTANGHFYKLYSAATIEQAMLFTENLPTYCGGKSGHLVTLTDASETAFVSAFAFDDFHQAIWLGMSDIQPNGTFQWVTGEPDTYKEWAPGHPATYRSVDYATLDSSGLWMDLAYDRWIEPDAPETFPFVVEYDCSLGAFSLCDSSSQCSPGQVCTSGLCTSPTTTNLALGASVTLDPNYQWEVDNAAAVVDGDTTAASYVTSPLARKDTCANPSDVPYVEIELPTAARIEAVVLYHFHGGDNPKRYCNQQVQLSLDGVDWITVYSTGTGYGPTESAQGHLVLFEPFTAKFIRHYLGRSTLYTGIHFIEVQVLGWTLPPCSSSSQCSDGLLCTSGRCASPDIKNLALGASVTLDPSHTRWWNTNSTALVDGDTHKSSWQHSPGGKVDDCSNPMLAPYVEIELPEAEAIEAVALFHYNGDSRQYCNQKVQLSLDGFNWTTVYSTGTDYGPPETAEGNLIPFEPVTAKFIRHFSGRSTTSNTVHFLEVQVYGSPVKFLPCSESTQCYYGEICSSGRCVPPEITNVALGAPVTLDPNHIWKRQMNAGVVDGDTTSASKDYAPTGTLNDCSDPETVPYVEIELPQVSVVEAVVLFHRHSEDTRQWRYCNQKVQLSLDGIKWNTVYATGTGYGPVETDEGHLITFEPYNAKYVRHYSGRNNYGTGIHFVEVQAFGEEYCKNGVPNADGTACCASGCSKCHGGDGGIGSPDIALYDCLVDHGAGCCPGLFEKDCEDVSDTLCLLPRPFCLNGVLNADGTACCGSGCTQCGGSGCSSAGNNCCTGGISEHCADEFDKYCWIPYD